MSRAYRGRFAPSPTGPLHAGSLVAALASWLDARAHGGRWLLRIEDTDGTRCLPGMDEVILAQLAALGLLPDEPPMKQSARGDAYARALEQLVAGGHAYPCGCSRSELARALSQRGLAPPDGEELVYPGTCRSGLNGRRARSWRLRIPDSAPKVPLQRSSAGLFAIDSGATVAWNDRRLGPLRQDVAAAVGDFVLKRADGPWAYQLAVVVDDAGQGITDVVRGEDLAGNTARQIVLQGLLGLPTPRYLHVPLVLGPDGAKLSKQNGAQALDTAQPLARLAEAAQVLGVPAQGSNVGDWLASATAAWKQRWTGGQPGAA